MISPEEQRHFTLVYSAAEAEATQGNRIRGYVWLREGLRRAQETDTPDRDALVALWDAGLRRFRELFPTEWYAE